MERDGSDAQRNRRAALRLARGAMGPVQVLGVSEKYWRLKDRGHQSWRHDELQRRAGYRGEVWIGCLEMDAPVSASDDALSGLRQRMIVATRGRSCRPHWFRAQHDSADDSRNGDAAEHQHQGNNHEALHWVTQRSIPRA